MTPPAAACQGERDSHEPDREGNLIDPIARLLRLAIDESGWKHTAIAAALDVEPAYLARMLAGEKPIGARHLLALPDDVEAIFARRYAERFGLIVVAPLEGQAAVQALVGGLFGVLSGGLPLKMARATLRTEKTSEVA